MVCHNLPDQWPVGITRHVQHPHPGLSRPKALGQLYTAHAGHHQVGEQQVDGIVVPFADLERFHSITCDQNPVAVCCQNLLRQDPDVRLAAVKDLGQIGPEAIPSLRKAMNNRSRNVRREAVRALAKMAPHSADAIPALRDALLDEDDYIWQAAADALKQSGESP